MDPLEEEQQRAIREGLAECYQRFTILLEHPYILCPEPEAQSASQPNPGLGGPLGSTPDQRSRLDLSLRGPSGITPDQWLRPGTGLTPPLNPMPVPWPRPDSLPRGSSGPLPDPQLHLWGFTGSIRQSGSLHPQQPAPDEANPIIRDPLFYFNALRRMIEEGPRNFRRNVEQVLPQTLSSRQLTVDSVQPNAHLQGLQNTISSAAAVFNLRYRPPARPLPQITIPSYKEPNDAGNFVGGLSKNPHNYNHSIARKYVLCDFRYCRTIVIDVLFAIFAFHIFCRPKRCEFDFVWSQETEGMRSKLDFYTVNDEQKVRITFNENLVSDCETLRDILLYQMARAMEYLRPGTYLADYAKIAYEELGLRMLPHL